MCRDPLLWSTKQQSLQILYSVLLHCKVTFLDNRRGTHPIFLSWLFVFISNGEKRCFLWSVITLLLQIWVYHRYIGQRRIGRSSWKVIRALFASSDMYSKFYLLLEISLENSFSYQCLRTSFVINLHC